MSPMASSQFGFYMKRGVFMWNLIFAVCLLITLRRPAMLRSRLTRVINLILSRTPKSTLIWTTSCYITQSVFLITAGWPLVCVNGRNSAGRSTPASTAVPERTDIWCKSGVNVPNSPILCQLPRPVWPHYNTYRLICRAITAKAAHLPRKYAAVVTTSRSDSTHLTARFEPIQAAHEHVAWANDGGWLLKPLARFGQRDDKTAEQKNGKKNGDKLRRTSCASPLLFWDCLKSKRENFNRTQARRADGVWDVVCRLNTTIFFFCTQAFCMQGK